MTTYVFPGQGSQCIGMGGTLFDDFPDITQKADAILGYSIKSLCKEDPDNNLTNTQYTQPALYVVNALTYFKKLRDTQQIPHYVAGHSLGEYNALLAAEVFDFETGLKLVKKRGEVMSQASGGGMAAIMGFTVDEIQTILTENHINNIILANYNSPIQSIISGPATDIAKAQPLFESKGLFRILNVSGAFHSPYMISAQQQFIQCLNQFTFASPKITIIANVNAKPYQQEEIKNNLANQLTQPVQWQQTIEYLLSRGEDTFEEIGTGHVLTSLIKNIKLHYKPVTT